MRIRTPLATLVLGTTVLVTQTPTALQSRPQSVASRTDPAVDAYTRVCRGEKT